MFKARVVIKQGMPSAIRPLEILTRHASLEQAFNLLARLARSTVLALLAAGLVTPPSLAATTPLAREIEVQHRNGDVAGARQRLEKALAEQPDDAGLRFLMGVVLSEAGQSADAARWFERMTQDFPELAEPHNNLAVLRAAAGQLDAARLLLETALRLAPDYRTARENLGDVHVRLAWRAYAAAADGVTVHPALQRKLTLARELSGLR
jgi:Flp pilus assembly protein TadD